MITGTRYQYLYQCHIAHHWKQKDHHLNISSEQFQHYQPDKAPLRLRGWWWPLRTSGTQHLEAAFVESKINLRIWWLGCTAKNFSTLHWLCWPRFFWCHLNVKPFQQSGCTQFGWWTTHLLWLMQNWTFNFKSQPLQISPTSPHPMSPVCSWRSLPMVSWPQAVGVVVGKLPAPPSCERILRGAVLDQAPGFQQFEIGSG